MNDETGASSSRLRRAELGERMAVYLPPIAAEQLRVRCARERRSLSDAVSEAVSMWLKAETRELATSTHERACIMLGDANDILCDAIDRGEHEDIAGAVRLIREAIAIHVEALYALKPVSA